MTCTINTKSFTPEMIGNLFINVMGLGDSAFRTQYEEMVDVAMKLDGVDEPVELTEEQKEERIEAMYGEVVSQDREQEKWVLCPVCMLGGNGNEKEQNARVANCTDCHGERGWMDDHSTINAYNTLSGTIKMETADDQVVITRNFEVVAPNKEFYSQAKQTIRAESNDEGLVVRAILTADKITNPVQRRVRLQKIWTRFWVNHFAWAENGQWWLSPKATKKIRLALNARGIRSKSL